MIMVERQPPPSFFAPHPAIIALKNLFITVVFGCESLVFKLNAQLTFFRGDCFDLPYLINF